ncbi:MAG: PINc/VapC family ATPase [Candidatus Nanoarchaeia archaeon]|nr:PINc/VapC family ATPase [Candidatus Nanoarchaeia archaeon]
MEERYVVDTSAVIEKAVTTMIDKGIVKGMIYIPRAVIAELERQANAGQETGSLGLDELQMLQELSRTNRIKIEIIGTRPNYMQIKYAKISGEVDSLIAELAYEKDAILITADKVQAESAKARGIKVKFVEMIPESGRLEFEKFFDDTTMSVHIKEDCYVYAKKGQPGKWNLTEVSKEKVTGRRIANMAKEIVEKTRMDPKAFVEIARKGSTIVQFRNYRIVIVRPPVSDGWEITAIRPLKVLNLEEYKLPEAIAERIKNKSRGVIIAGETGSGKSTFAQAIAEYYAAHGKITKTVESPRDLQLSDNITQYSKNFTSSEEIHDILFLSRPDNVVFDEVRDTPDFNLYVDLRLAGSNCIGVLHAAAPIDAVQRFISRLDTGMIPSVLDTIIFIENGNIGKVLTLKMTVKIPSGMVESDLARPVVVVSDFETGQAAYEIYSYGEETVVIPLSDIPKQSSSPAREIASRQLTKELQKYSSKVKVEVIDDHKAKVFLPNSEIGKFIGKQGKHVEAMEQKLGIKLDVEPLEGEETETEFNIGESKKDIVFYTGESNKEIDVYLNGQFLLSATTSKKGELRVNKRTKVGDILFKAINRKEKVELRA